MVWHRRTVSESLPRLWSTFCEKNAISAREILYCSLKHFYFKLQSETNSLKNRQAFRRHAESRASGEAVAEEIVAFQLASGKALRDDQIAALTEAAWKTDAEGNALNPKKLLTYRVPNADATRPRRAPPQGRDDPASSFLPPPRTIDEGTPGDPRSSLVGRERVDKNCRFQTCPQHRKTWSTSVLVKNALRSVVIWKVAMGRI